MIEIEKDKIDISEITTKDELNARGLFRSDWIQFYALPNSIKDEGETLACVAFSIKKINDKSVSPQEAFEYIMKIPRKYKDKLVLEYQRRNQSEDFFSLLANLAGISINKDSSLQDSVDSAGETQESSQKQSSKL